MMGAGATVRLSRPAARGDRWRAYRIVLDGEVVGRIKHGKQQDFSITAGEHSLYLKVDWCRSRSVTFHADDGDVIGLTCAPTAGGAAFSDPANYVSLQLD